MRNKHEFGQFLGEDKQPVSNEPVEREPFSWQKLLPILGQYAFGMWLIRFQTPATTIKVIAVRVAVPLTIRVAKKVKLLTTRITEKITKKFFSGRKETPGDSSSTEYSNL